MISYYDVSGMAQSSLQIFSTYLVINVVHSPQVYCTSDSQKRLCRLQTSAVLSAVQQKKGFSKVTKQGLIATILLSQQCNICVNIALSFELANQSSGI